MPKWATTPRQLYLAKLTLPYLAISGWTLDIETGEVYHPQLERLYRQYIANWQADDRDEAEALWQVELLAIHRLGEVGKAKGEFNAVAKDIYFGRQPQFYLEGVGVNAVTHKPFVKVRLASSYVSLFIDIAEVLKPLSKNARHKATRYGKISPRVKGEIEALCSKAVRVYRR